jgi:hypothetical protein
LQELLLKLSKRQDLASYCKMNEKARSSKRSCKIKQD